MGFRSQDFRHLRARGVPAALPARAAKRQMNSTEASYAAHLGLRQLAGEIVGWKYEAVKLRLGEGCWYTPDFLIVLRGGRIEFAETKGFERDDAITKFKCAAEMLPWITFRMFKRQGDGWIETRTLNG